MDDGPRIPAEASSPGADERVAPLSTGPGLRAAIRNPVVAILFLAGVFDGISGNPIHSILLFSVALVLGRDVALGRDHPPSASGQSSVKRVVATPWPSAVAILAAATYAVIVGGFGRYSWPMTVAVVVPGAIVLMLAWREASDPRPDVAPLDPFGALAWISALVGLAIWELAALLLQPTLTTDSRAHPTISVLTDPALATHPGRSIALLLWLGLGWFIMQR